MNLTRLKRLVRGTARRWSAAGILLLPIGVLLAQDVFNGHKVVLDSQGKIVPWFAPAEKAYDHFLRLRWNFIKTKVPSSPGPAPRSDYPQYYFYDGYVTKEAKITPDKWMNHVGEKIPNWFESARLYYAYAATRK